MKVEIKNYKRFNGHDGQGYDYSLYIDNKRTAIISNDGWGGELMVERINPILFAEFEKRTSELPAETFTEEANPEWETEEREFTLDMSWDIWIDDLVNIADLKKQSQKITVKCEDKLYFFKQNYSKKRHVEIVKFLDARDDIDGYVLVNAMKAEKTL